MKACTQEGRTRSRLEACTTMSAIAAAIVLAFLILPAPALWALMRAEALTLDYQVRESDVVARGTCVDINTAWANKHLVTTYKIAVNKYIKAPGKMSLATHPVLMVSQLGGRVEKPLPLEESTAEMAVLARNENVVLFLQSPERVPAALRAKYDAQVQAGTIKPSPLMANFRLTALNYSKLSVVTDPKTGAQQVVRFNFDRSGMLPTSEAAQKFIDAYNNQQGYVEVMQGNQKVRIPVPVNAKPTGAAPAATIEEKIRQLQTYSAPWDAFEQQVKNLMNQPGGATIAPATAGNAVARP